MKQTTVWPNSSTAIVQIYEAPELTFIGDAVDVVMGLPGDGWDGPHGLSLPQFEFEDDEK